MRSRAEIIAKLVDPGIVAIIRTDRPEQVIPVTEALLAGGIVAVEITLTVPNALEAIRQAVQRFGQQAVIGAGTVLDARAAEAVIQAGAEYVVTPITRVQIVSVAHAADRPVMLGAYTPTEAQTAYEAGADFIKLFPADTLGPGYIKALRAPLPHLRIVPTGGVDLNTAADFLRAGCAALGVGSALVSADLVKRSDWAELTRRSRAFVEIARSVRAAQATQAS
jgi:2-dehydro-3-deoxyphosphogluconate aldolase/(4S)-4-hydroxy-2-oxoglutarate aldolase